MSAKKDLLFVIERNISYIRLILCCVLKNVRIAAKMYQKMKYWSHILKLQEAFNCHIFTERSYGIFKGTLFNLWEQLGRSLHQGSYFLKIWGNF